jgi:LysR family transcriptional regulator, glycine cleavage system transcriptional activator
MKRTLLPLNALRVFEAAARHLSFTRAADELAVTPAAVGQHIRSLEDVLGVVLFRRTARSLELTPEAERAIPALQDGFGKFEEAVALMQAAQNSSVITLSVPPSFASKWLVPRLDRFMAQHPAMQMRLLASEKLTDFAQENVDLAIRFGAGRYEPLVAEKLLDEAVIPVAAPTLASSLTSAAALTSAMLIHDDSALDDPEGASWPMWLKAAHVDHPSPERGIHLNLSSLVVEAAVAGKGVALARMSLAARDLVEGRLVRLFAGTGAKGASFAYWLVAPQPQWKQKKVQALVQWLRHEAAQVLAFDAQI